MPKRLYKVVLSPAEKRFLRSITHSDKGYTARELLHAQVLLHSNDGKPASKMTNKQIAARFGISAPP